MTTNRLATTLSLQLVAIAIHRDTVIEAAELRVRDGGDGSPARPFIGCEAQDAEQAPDRCTRATRRAARSMSAARTWFWLACDFGEPHGVGATDEDARRDAARSQRAAADYLARQHFSGAMNPAEIEAWAAALAVSRVELHGDPRVARIVVMRLALDVPGVLFLPSVQAALATSEAKAAA